MPQTDWPIEDVQSGYEPHFVFLLTLPNSGSTAIAKVLETSPNFGLLERRGEGQWLIDGLSASDRWEKDKFIDEKSLRSVWVNRCIEINKREGSKFFIEKSPPNMVRIDLLKKLFPRNTLIANNRNPYAAISSILHRRSFKNGTAGSSLELRNSELGRLANKWLVRSQILRRLIIRDKIPVITYERFCANPNVVREALLDRNLDDPIELDFQSKLVVKDYEPQRIRNFNDEQINKLTRRDISEIANILKDHQDLLAFFGYKL